jgi:hypothetical protein
MMQRKRRVTRYGCVFAVAFGMLVAAPAGADENLNLYGGKGYLYTLSPGVVDGWHAQAGLMYSLFHKNNLTCRDGYIWTMPLSLTYGDGDWWEVAAGTHYESWENTDFDDGESGLGDLHIGGKLRLAGQDRGQPLNVSLHPYFRIPTGNRDKGIGDLHRWSQSDGGDVGAGLDLLLGRRWGRFAASLQLGVNALDADDPFVDDTAVYAGLAAEYQLAESLLAYLELFTTENKNSFTCEVCSPCYDPDITDDIRELGAGVTWLKGLWGLKLHVGTGLTETSPDLRVTALINRNLAY